MCGNWKYETCKCCTREQRIAWYAKDAIWNAATIPYYRKKTLCLECFLRMAEDNGVRVTVGDIEFAGIIFRDD